MNTFASKQTYMNDMPTTSEIIQRFGKNFEALQLPALVWSEAVVGSLSTDPNDLYRGIRVETSDNSTSPVEITVGQIDGTSITIKVLPFVDYGMITTGVASIGSNVSKVWLAK